LTGLGAQNELDVSELADLYFHLQHPDLRKIR